MEIISNRTKEYYKKNKKVLREEATNYLENREIQGIVQKRTNLKREYKRNKYKNVSRENKQKLKEYQKSYHKAKKLL